MTAFRIFLGAILLILAAYSLVVIGDHGVDLYSVFFGDMAKMEWAGQFNLDFMFMLMLSGLWVAWRNQFSAGGLVLGLLAFMGGALFLSVYLLFLVSQTKGDMRQLLLGTSRA